MRLRVQESTIVTLQNQVAKLRQQIGMLRIENHVLRVRNGEVLQEMIREGTMDGSRASPESISGDGVRRSLLEWGEVAAALQMNPGMLDQMDATHMTGKMDVVDVLGTIEAGTGAVPASKCDLLFVFCHELMVWSIQRWIRSRSGGDMVLESPGSILREVVRRDEGWCSKRVDVLVMLIESLIGVRCMRGTLAELVRDVLGRWCDGNFAEDGGLVDAAEPLENVLMDRFVSSDAVRSALLMPEACGVCLDRLQRFIRDGLGVSRAPEGIEAAKGVDRTGRAIRDTHDPLAELTATDLSTSSESPDVYTLMDLLWVCDTCISRLGTVDQSPAVSIDGEVLGRVASDVFDVSQQCEVIAGILPDVALAGKRLQCQLVAALQRMESKELANEPVLSRQGP